MNIKKRVTRLTQITQNGQYDRKWSGVFFIFLTHLNEKKHTMQNTGRYDRNKHKNKLTRVK